MKIGLFECDITPPLGFASDGSGLATREAESIEDPLFVRVVSLHDAHGGVVVLLGVDLLYVPRDMTWRIKQWAKRTLGIDGSAIITNASHTHCGPYLHPVNRPAEIEYVERVESTFREGVAHCIAHAEPGVVKFAACESHFGINRRRPEDKTNPDPSPRTRANEAGYYDPDLPVLAFFDASGTKMRGLLYSYAAHPTSRAGAWVSADYPGAVATSLKTQCGDEFIPIFMQGAGGNTRTRFYDPQTYRWYRPTREQFDALGAEIATTILEQMPGRLEAVDLRITAAQAEFDIPYDLDRRKTFDELLALAEPGDDGDIARSIVVRSWARKMLEDIHMDRSPTHHRMALNIVRLSDKIMIVALSDEIVAEIGRDIKAMFPDQRVVVFGYCGHTEVYVPTASMLDEYGYEDYRSVQYTLQHNIQPAPFAPQTEQIIMNHVRDLAC